MRTLAADNTVCALRVAQTAISAPAVAWVQEEARKQRTIYDAHNSFDLPGECDPQGRRPATGNPAADEAYDGLGATFDFLGGLRTQLHR
jgi:hypothetical protein